LHEFARRPRIKLLHPNTPGLQNWKEEKGEQPAQGHVENNGGGVLCFVLFWVWGGKKRKEIYRLTSPMQKKLKELKPALLFHTQGKHSTKGKRRGNGSEQRGRPCPDKGEKKTNKETHGACYSVSAVVARNVLSRYNIRKKANRLKKKEPGKKKNKP